jgi:hypothetical protein
METHSNQDIATPTSRPSIIDILIDNVIKLKQVSKLIKAQNNQSVDAKHSKFEQETLILSNWTQERQLLRVNTENVRLSLVILIYACRIQGSANGRMRIR